MSEFSQLLRRCREQAGYASAREFFKSCGGRSALGCTYAQYLNIESGRSTPKAKLFNAVVVMLGLWKDPENSRRLCKAYLTALLGGGEPLDFIVRSLGPAPRTPGSAASPLRKAMAQVQAARLKPLTAEQSRLIRRDVPCYWVYRILSSDSGSWTPERLAALLGIGAASARRALEDLVAAGLAVRGADGGCWSPGRDHHMVHERPVVRENHAASPFMPQMRRLWDHMARRHGEILFDHYLVLRASESEIRGYYPYFAQAVGGLGVYDTIDKGPDTAVLLVEATVRRLLPF